MAAQQIVAAREAHDSNDRATAIRRAGRALALDPESADAASLVTSLLLEPPDPDHMPPDLVEQLAIDDKVFNSSRSRQGAWTYLSLFVFWLVIPFMDVKSWTALITFYGLLGMGAAIAWRNSMRGYSSMPVTLVMTTLVALMFTRISGPFILTPVVICASLMQLAATRQIAERLWIIVVWVCVAVLLPFLLEWFHVIDSTYQVHKGVIVSTSRIFDMRTGLDEATLVLANFLFILAAAVVGVFISRRRMTAQRQLQIQAWHLRQLLPTAKRWQTQPRGKRMLVK